MKILEFDRLYELLPEGLKELLYECSITPQSPTWHPEGPNEKVPHNVLVHTRIVYERAKKFGNFDLAIAALFHDLGKTTTTYPSNKTKGSWSSYGHEMKSAQITEQYKDWIIKMGADFDCVYTVVKNHMKIKYFHELRQFKKDEFLQNPYFDQIKQFSTFDSMSTLTVEEMLL